MCIEREAWAADLSARVEELHIVVMEVDLVVDSAANDNVAVTIEINSVDHSAAEEVYDQHEKTFAPTVCLPYRQ